MKVLVMSCSPKGEFSLTYNSSKFLEKMFPDVTFNYHFTTNGVFPDDAIKDFDDADVVLVLSSIFHFSVHSQMIDLFDDMRKKLGDRLANKPITYLTTSGKNAEYNAHDYVRNFAEDADMYWIASLSIKDVSVLSEEGREELYCWFRFVLNCLDKDIKFKDKAHVVVLDVFESDADDVDSLVEKAEQKYRDYGAEVKVIRLREKNIKPCVACSSCYTNRECMIEDEYESLVDEVRLNTDVIFYVGKLNLGSLGVNLKRFIDRGVQFGRSGEAEGIITSYVCLPGSSKSYQKDLVCFQNYQRHLENVDGNFNVGFFTDKEFDKAILQTVSAYNADVMPQETGITTGLYRQFAWLASFIRNLEPADYEFFKERGFYDEVQVNPHSTRINNPAEAAEVKKGRVIPYKMTLMDCDGKIKITVRRAKKGRSFVERKKEYARKVLENSNKPKKRGFFKRHK